MYTEAIGYDTTNVKEENNYRVWSTLSSGEQFINSVYVSRYRWYIATQVHISVRSFIFQCAKWVSLSRAATFFIDQRQRQHILNASDPQLKFSRNYSSLIFFPVQRY